MFKLPSQQKWYEKNRERALLRMRQWYRKNKEHKHAQDHQRYYADLNCSRQKARDRYQRRRKIILKNARKWRLRNLSKVKAYRQSERYRELTKKYNQQSRERQKDWTLKNQFGMSLDNYNAILKKQKGVCAICAKPETRENRWGTKTKNLAVDHCHSTRRVRGLLCSRCNAGLAMFNDDVHRLKSAIRYLSRSLHWCS